MSSRECGRWLAAFVDELSRLGVRDAVISPGSRSTPLAMTFDRSDEIRTYVDLDERGAAYLALGIAKAAGRPVCVICTSGTAAANYYPAICEARAARVPLVVLTADRPHTLRSLGANQTTDQIKMFGDVVVFFHEMPLPDGSENEVAFVRQMAREAVIRATGRPNGPVHLNFPFEEPLVPDLPAHAFETGRRSHAPLVEETRCSLGADVVERLNASVAGKHGIILCGAGEYPDAILDLSRRLGFPVLADPLSGLRRHDDPAVVSSYDNIFRREDLPPIEVVLRFGPYPVSKSTFTTLKRIAPLTIVVDEAESRDYNHIADVFVRARPDEFIEAAGALANNIGPGYASEWARLDREEATKIGGAAVASPVCDGSYVLTLLDGIEPGSVLFASNSMAIRYLDTFYTKRDRDLRVLCSRGLSGIDGVLSSAVGASLHVPHATLLIGDIAFLHDINALHLRRIPGADLTVVLMNNDGGGIFEMLPQKGQDGFERLFRTPHGVDFEPVVRGFGVPYVRVEDVEAFSREYAKAQRQLGIRVIEVRSSSKDLAENYRRYC